MLNYFDEIVTRHDIICDTVCVVFLILFVIYIEKHFKQNCFNWDLERLKNECKLLIRRANTKVFANFTEYMKHITV